MSAQRERRPGIRRAVVYLPNGFTLFTLFCGIFAIVLSSRGIFGRAALFVFIGGISDALDGRVARATGTGSPIGEELDSLVDAITFGLAPGLIMYFAVLNRDNWEWLFVFIFSACAVMRLARFNVEQAGHAKTHFHGLPSPAAGLTLSTYYWFSQTPLYNQTIILFTDNKTLAELPWHAIIPGLMGLLSALMVSNVPYPAVPTIGWRRPRQIIGSVVILAAIVGLIVLPYQFFFPAALAYVLYGALKWLVLGLLGRRSEPGDIYFELEPYEGGEPVPVAPPSVRRATPAGTAVIAAGASAASAADGIARRKRRRRGRRNTRPEGMERIDRNAKPQGSERPDRDRNARPEGDHNERQRRPPPRGERPGRPDQGVPSSSPSSPPSGPSASAPFTPLNPNEDPHE